MKNLDQIRATAALNAASDTTKQAASKLPSLIITNGLLASIAFADERKKDEQPKRAEMKNAMDSVAKHLSNPIHEIEIIKNITTAKELLGKLTTGDANSLHLQRATSESLLFLAYLKRFATKEEEA